MKNQTLDDEDVIQEQHEEKLATLKSSKVELPIFTRETLIPIFLFFFFFFSFLCRRGILKIDQFSGARKLLGS